MDPMVRSFRMRPVGWRSDSYRHYLAAKGISTSRGMGHLSSKGVSSGRHRYFAKGNTLPWYYKQAFAGTKDARGRGVAPMSRDEFEAKLSAMGRSDLIVPRGEKMKFVEQLPEGSFAVPENMPAMQPAPLVEPLEPEEEQGTQSGSGVGNIALSDTVSPGVADRPNFDFGGL